MSFQMLLLALLLHIGIFIFEQDWNMIKGNNDYIESLWLNGKGKTQQFFINPPTAQLKLQNFKIRISSATVTKELTPFSRFQSFHRYLALLKGGPLHLSNKDAGKQIIMHPFEQILSFDGEENWECLSQDQGKDFNFFVQKEKESSMSILEIIGKKTLALNKGANILYNGSEGQCQIEWHEQLYMLKGGQLFVASPQVQQHLSVKGDRIKIIWCWANQC